MTSHAISQNISNTLSEEFEKLFGNSFSKEFEEQVTPVYEQIDQVDYKGVTDIKHKKIDLEDFPTPGSVV